PAILKPHDGGGWRDVYKVDSKEELWRDYDKTGTLAMTLQEFIDFELYVRCYCVGRKHVLVMPYDPKNRRYVPKDEQVIPQELEDRIVRDTILINEALGYDLNTTEFAIKDGVPYAIDFTNPAPDADIWSVTEPYFNWVTDAVANMLVDYAKNGAPTAHYHRWYRWLNGGTTSEAAAGAGQLAQNIFTGVEQMAQKASDVLAEVINQITEPIKPNRTRRASTEKSGSEKTASEPKSTKNTKGTKSSKTSK
ncbi:MAG: hypothetical protein M3X11_19800, partial [Acidobacteriota bacterium]|nr:hypothetical protein [Acidobacteriota bacterium]